jgi:hypothetical protein
MLRSAVLYKVTDVSEVPTASSLRVGNWSQDTVRIVVWTEFFRLLNQDNNKIDTDWNFGKYDPVSISKYRYASRNDGDTFW